MGSGLRVENFKINQRLTTSGNALQAKRNGTCSAVLSIGAVVFRLGHGVDAGRTAGGFDAGVSGCCGAVGMVPIGSRVGVFVAPGSADDATVFIGCVWMLERPVLWVGWVVFHG